MKKTNADARKRLKDIVPGYVWAQPGFHIEWEPARPVIQLAKGLILIESPSKERREYAAASLLSLFQRLNYHADIGWTSFYPRKENEFTGSVWMPSPRAIHVIAVQTELAEFEIDQVEDMASQCAVGIIASYPLPLTLHHSTIKLSANNATTERV